MGLLDRGVSTGTASVLDGVSSCGTVLVCGWGVAEEVAEDEDEEDEEEEDEEEEDEERERRFDATVDKKGWGSGYYRQEEKKKGTRMGVALLCAFCVGCVDVRVCVLQAFSSACVFLGDYSSCGRVSVGWWGTHSLVGACFCLVARLRLLLK